MVVRLTGKVPPVCGRTGGKVARLAQPRTGPLYKTRPLGSAFGNENILALWHRGHGAKPEDHLLNPDTDNKVALSVRYLNAGDEREAFRVTVGSDGRLMMGAHVMDTRGAKPLRPKEPGGTYMFVMDGLGRIYAADNQKEFTSGRTVVGKAGETTGFLDYQKAAADDLVARLVEGVVTRQFVEAGPTIDFYKTALLDAAVPCALALPGGKPSSSEIDQAEWDKLRRTPFSGVKGTKVFPEFMVPRAAPAAPEPEPAGMEDGLGEGGQGLGGGEDGVSLGEDNFVVLDENDATLIAKYKLPDDGFACLKTIQPGLGMFVNVAPRQPNGSLDLPRFLDAAAHSTAWTAAQTDWKAKWTAREKALGGAAPFRTQTFPGANGKAWLSDIPNKDGWVCRNCYARRKKWPLLVYLKPTRDALESCKKQFLEDPEAGGLQRVLQRRGLITEEQVAQLGDMVGVSAPRRVEVFHHSSFLAAGEVAAAGELRVASGLLTDVTDQSGHYLPAPKFMYQVIKELARQRADLSCTYLHWDRGSQRAKVAIGKALDPGLPRRLDAIPDARDTDGSFGSGAAAGSEVRAQIKERFEALGVRMSNVEITPTSAPHDGPVLCVNAMHGCKETSATENLEYFPERGGYVCVPCIKTEQALAAAAPPTRSRRGASE